MAISLSNLAILHNQRGEYSKAQPLYERALEIFELNFGPSDANVAHTLTDLAVLHLEQVHLVLLCFRLCMRGPMTCLKSHISRLGGDCDWPMPD